MEGTFFSQYRKPVIIQKNELHLPRLWKIPAVICTKGDGPPSNRHKSHYEVLPAFANHIVIIGFEVVFHILEPRRVGQDNDIQILIAIEEKRSPRMSAMSKAAIWKQFPCLMVSFIDNQAILGRDPLQRSSQYNPSLPIHKVPSHTANRSWP